MAEFQPLLVRQLPCPPGDVIPLEAWQDVVAQIGELVVAWPVTVKNQAGKLSVGFRWEDETFDKIKAILIEHSDEPWTAELMGDWQSDADAWKQ